MGFQYGAINNSSLFRRNLPKLNTYGLGSSYFHLKLMNLKNELRRIILAINHNCLFS